MLRKLSKVLTVYFRSSLQTLEHQILTPKATPNLFQWSGKIQGNEKACFGRFRKGKELTQGHIWYIEGVALVSFGFGFVSVAALPWWHVFCRLVDHSFWLLLRCCCSFVLLLLLRGVESGGDDALFGPASFSVFFLLLLTLSSPEEEGSALFRKESDATQLPVNGKVELPKVVKIHQSEPSYT
jgi:hypothetical protein